MRELPREELLPLPPELLLRVPEVFDSDFEAEVFRLPEDDELLPEAPVDLDPFPFGAAVELPDLDEEDPDLPVDAISISGSSTLDFVVDLLPERDCELPLPDCEVSYSASILILLSAISVNNLSASYSSSRVSLKRRATSLCPNWMA